MNTKIERYYKFVTNNRTRKICAFIYYIWAISVFSGIEMPLTLDIISIIIFAIITLICFPTYICEYLDELYDKNKGKVAKNIVQEIKKIFNELVMFIPIQLASMYINSLLLTGKPENQSSIENVFYEKPIIYSLIIIIIGPIIEEIIFRVLPKKL